MTWLEPISTAATAVSLGVELVKSTNAIRKYAMRISHWVKHGSLVLPIFGAGGVGKSTAGRILAGDDPLELASVYAESREKEFIHLKGEVPGYVVVGPGQGEGEFGGRVGKHWPSMYRDVVAGHAQGVVNFVAYGFHSLGIESYKQHDLYEPGMTVEDFLPKYLAARRATELQTAKKLADGLTAAKGPLQILTVVNKQDLWWDQRHLVKQHYAGAYAEVFHGLGTSLGAQNFRHEPAEGKIAPVERF